MSDNTLEGAKPLYARLFTALLLTAALFSGCGQSEEAVPADLPSVTDYSSAVSSIRSSEASETTSRPTEVSSDSETVSAGDAASRQTEAETSAEESVSETPKAKLPGQSPQRPPFPHLSRLKRLLRRLQQLFRRHLTPRLLHLPLRLSLLRNAPYLRLLPLRLTPIMTRTFSLPTFSSVTQFQRDIPCTDF